MQRVTKFVKYLERYGWRCTVICGRPEDYWMRDDTLVEDLPLSTRLHPVAGASGLGILRRLRPRATPSSVRSATGFGKLRRLASWFLLPDSYIGWRSFALRAARQVMQADPVQAILSTGPPETNHLVAAPLQQESGVPWVADFRDPWFALHLYPAPTALHRWRHTKLEAQVLAQADGVLATTEWLGELLRQRSPAGQVVQVIRNGFDPEDFSAPVATTTSPDCDTDALAMSAASSTSSTSATAPLRLVHAGMLTLTRSATGLLEGLRHLLQQHPEYAQSIHIDLIGTRESDNDNRIDDLGLRQSVSLHDYVPHQEAIARMRQADVLVLIKHTEQRFRGLIPGKLYEYIGARRPILAFVPESEAADIIRQSGCGEVVAADDPPAIAAHLEQLLLRKRAGTLQADYACRETEPFNRQLQTAALAQLLDRLVQQRSVAHPAEVR